jgi:nucleolar MIF4G domain-containing protein 1
MPISTQIKARKELRKLQRKAKRKRHDVTPAVGGYVVGNSNGIGPEKSLLSDQNENLQTANHIVKKTTTETTKKEKSFSERERLKHSNNRRDEDDPYGALDSNTANLLRRDDEEIAALGKKLGLTKRKEKEKLYKEYSKLEGYGDDFGEFLEDLDDMLVRLKRPNDESSSSKINKRPRSCALLLSDQESDFDFDEESESSDGEELVPMKGPCEELDEDDSILEELERMEKEERASQERQESSEFHDDEKQHGSQQEEQSSEDEDSKSQSSDSSEEEHEGEADHHVSDTYYPSKGEDIYGNFVDNSASNGTTPSKYIPPHLRKKQQADEGDQERRREVNRLLNNAMNRLSEDTVISVAKQVAGIFASNPTQLVHEQVWKNVKDACIELPMLMTGLIPVYMACLTGVHVQTSDTIQVGETLLEYVVVELWQQLKFCRNNNFADTEDEMHQKEIKSKHICNLILVLAYLYNFNLVHCSFMYNVIRHLISNFSEVDIECLLILLSHCGKSLRSDDPLALKDIVLLVQKEKAENSRLASSSRAEYMISAIMDLKNNRRKKQDTVFSEKVGKFRKLLGQVKSTAVKSGVSKTSSDASLRISLDDILNAETKGRWWKVGASWVGNQYRFTEGMDPKDADESKRECESFKKEKEEDEYLLKIASKLRMNTDRKRAIFCIIMGGTDCEDTFEKLCRSSMLQNRSERDAVRVLLECCGQEKSYNKFYGHLAARICEFQPQSKFSLQLAYWDIFKHFDSMEVRKAANLAKLLFYLIVHHQTLKLLPVIKTIDISQEDMDETTLIFLTILFSSMLAHYDDPTQVKRLLARPRSLKDDEDTGNAQGQDEGVRTGLLVFFMKTLKSSPKNIKGSQFRRNFKAAVKELDSDGFENMF